MSIAPGLRLFAYKNNYAPRPLNRVERKRALESPVAIHSGVQERGGGNRKSARRIERTV